MKRTIILYGLALALFVSGLKFLEYRFFVRDLSIEFYTGIIVVIFTGLGIWIGLRLTWKKFVFVGGDFTLDAATLQKLDITKQIP